VSLEYVLDNIWLKEHSITVKWIVLFHEDFESLRVHSPRLAAVVVIPAEAGIQENGLDSVSSTE